MSNFWQRTLTGAVYVLIVVLAVSWNVWTFIGLLFLINFLGLMEYPRLFRGRDYAPNLLTMLVCGVSIFVLACLSWFGYYGSALAILPVVFLPFIIELYGKRQAPFQRAALSIGGFVYLTASLLCFILVAHRDGAYHYQLPLGYFILIWSSDTFAYLSGRAFGRHPLFPRVSPKKTWEGSIGGAICTVGIAILLWYSSGILTLPVWVGLALVIMVFGTWGDLIESMLKRSLELKDSGNILPGHGGILDRFDSLLFSLPFAAAFLYFFG